MRLLNGGPAIRIAAASLVALTVTMCSYWAQSSIRPAAVPLSLTDDDAQRTTAKSDRLDAYMREEHVAGVLLDAPAKTEISTALGWPLADRVRARLHVGPHGERAYGIQITVPSGTPVRAAADGVVDFAGKATDGYGNKIIIHHGKIRTVYGHLSDVLVTANAKVRRGQVIAKSGESGFVTSPQLYLGLLGAEPSVDPMAFFAKAGTLDRCAGGHGACAGRKSKASVVAPLGERPPIPPANIPFPGSHRAAKL